jgi:hypothetical protein
MEVVYVGDGVGCAWAHGVRYNSLGWKRFGLNWL